MIGATWDDAEGPGSAVIELRFAIGAGLDFGRHLQLSPTPEMNIYIHHSFTRPTLHRLIKIWTLTSKGGRDTIP
jgi:hypothetical protein